MVQDDFAEVGRLLMVDDEINILKSYRRLFIDSPYEIVCAGSGKEALEKAAAFKPHIVLLDIMMPDLDGYEVCQSLSADPETRGAEIIFISALTTDPARLKAYQTGADDFIAKPINPEELLSKIAAKMRRRAQYAAEVMVDPLTGIGNRRHFDRSLNQYLRMSTLYGKSLALTVIDIDFFKKINDTWGHDSGDYVLFSLASLLKSCIREKDRIARIGGEEFVLLMPDIHYDEAVAALERLRQRIETTVFKQTERQIEITLTVSMGTALFPEEGQEGTALFKVADTNLYRAKNTGRNRVIFTRT